MRALAQVATSSSSIQLPPTDQPVFYLHQRVSRPKHEWEQLTGKSFSTSSPEEIAQAFRPVVKKQVEKPGPRREDYGSWLSANRPAPTPSQEAQAEADLSSTILDQVLVGAIYEGFGGEGSLDDDSMPMMHVDYFVIQSAPSAEGGPDEISPAFGEDRPARSMQMVPFLVGFAISAIGVGSMVKKPGGMRVLAGFAGGIIGGGIVAQIALAMGGDSREEAELPPLPAPPSGGEENA